MTRRYLVTGGAGFIGSALAHRLAQRGHAVRVFDDESRGSASRLAGLSGDWEFVRGDVRDARLVADSIRGVDGVFHLAAVNGTERFYREPDRVLDVGVRGMLNVMDGCIQHGVQELVVASSSEVYQSPPAIPTDETVPLSIPDPLNPRYSYAGSKIVSELVALHHGGRHLRRVMIFRPHNVYGPDMGREHVIPELVLRLQDLCRGTRGVVRLPIQGSGEETRAFVYVDDVVDGVLLMHERGRHLGIYHVGTTDEVRIADLARRIAERFGREVELVAGRGQPGSASRRCPDVTRLAALGYRPRVGLEEGLSRVVDWYRRSCCEEVRPQLSP